MLEKTDGESALNSGLVAAVTVAGLHEISRRLLKDAPRLDIMGEKLIEKGFHRFGREPPKNTRLLSWALGNVGSDTLLFALVGAGNPKRPLLRGLLLGIAAGVSALVLPPLLGIGKKDTARNPKTAALTLGVYVAAGLAAGGAQHLSAALED